MDKQSLLSFISRFKYLILIFIFVIITCFVGENSYLIRRAAQKKEIQQLEEEIRQLDAQIEINNRLLESLEKDTAVKERIARERYKMHSPSEDIFIEQSTTQK